MKLSKEQRQSLSRGECTSLMFPYDPEDEQTQGRQILGACCMVLNWEKARRGVDRDGNVFTIDREPLRWIEVTSIKRHRKGDWQVRFDVTDRRDTERYLRRVPEWSDPHSNSTSDPIAEADRSSYTSSRFRAIDDLPAVPRRYQEQLSKKAYERDRVRRLEQVAARRTDRWRSTRERRKAIDRLRSAA